jgi:serine/threonine-protein kinase
MFRPAPERAARARGACSIVATALRRGSSLGKYRLERRIGRGGFADVWKARDTVEHRDVALKVFLPETVEEFGREAIEREARIASRLHHPNVVEVRNADWLDGRFVIASDLAQGSLASFTSGRRSAARSLRAIRQVAAGLAYAHERRILHRDVKPENVLLFADGHVALGDFGESRLTRTIDRSFTEVGTLGYMAPEQAYGRPQFASDVFSLGLMAYQILTGVLPTWPFTWPPEGFARFRAVVPAPVQKVLRRAAEFEPRRRHPDAVVFHRALEKAFADAERGAQARPRRRRRRPQPPPSSLAVQARLFRRAHGRALGLRYRCRRCDGPMSEPMRVCPWCGAGDNSLRDVTVYSRFCRHCERGVRPEWTACPWCFEGRFEGNGRRPPPDRQAVRRCGRRGCAGELRPFMRYCPMCKRKTPRPWTHASLPDRCPRCRWATSREFFHFCPWCGRREPGAGQFRRHRS